MDEIRIDTTALVVLVTGDREWNDLETMVRELETLPPNTILIHGDCRGADKMAGLIGDELGLTVVPVPADWIQYGKSAGPIRNRKMYDTYKPTLVLAFHKNINQSSGTRDMMNYAKSKGCTDIRLITR